MQSRRSRLSRALALLAVLLAAEPLRAQGQTSAPASFRATSRHYLVISEVSRASARDAAELLEAAWPQWRARFGVEPPARHPQSPLSVRIFGDKQGLARRVAADLGQETGDVLGWTDWRTGDVYAVHHALPYERRRILLHEGTHQFHYLLAAAGKKDPYPFWYAEGVAHDCERHTWTDGRLQLMRPRSPQTADAVELALASTRVPLWRMDAYLERGGYARGVDERSMAWALVRFFRTADGGRYAGMFADLERRFRGRADRIGLIRSSPWSEKELERAFIAWLRTRVPVSGRLRGMWTSTGPDHTARFVPHHLCLELLTPRPAQAPGLRVAFRFSRAPAADEQVGFVLGVRSPLNNTFAWFDGKGRFHLCERRDGRYGQVRSWALPGNTPAAGDEASMMLDASGRLDVRLRGESLLEPPPPPLKASGGAGLYAGVSASAATPPPARQVVRQFTFRGVRCTLSTP